MTQTNQRTLLIISNFLSSVRGTSGPSEALATRLKEKDWFVLITSDKSNRVLRILDMLTTVVMQRLSYKVAIIDVFSGPSFFWAEACGYLLRFLKKPFVLVLHGGKLPLFSKKHPKRVRRLFSMASSITTPSVYIRLELNSNTYEITLLRNAIDLSAYTFRHRKIVQPKLTWLRAFHSIYNPSLAAETISLLISDFPDIQLTMYGPDKDDGSLEKTRELIQQFGMDHQIKLVGQISNTEVPKELGQYDIFLNTTTAESFGVAVMEAAALGMCIITTDAGELPYIWTHEHDAMIVPSDDADAMAKAIRRVLTEPELAEKLSRNARIKAEQFDRSYILPQWTSLITEVIEKHYNA